MSYNYITLSPNTTASLHIDGIMMDRTANIILSSYSVTCPGSIIYTNDFTTNARVSAFFPTVSGYNYTNYSIGDNYDVYVNVYGLTGNGPVDIIFNNEAGYSKLSDRNFLLYNG